MGCSRSDKFRPIEITIAAGQRQITRENLAPLSR
jgi:hypothetical protein